MAVPGNRGRGAILGEVVESLVIALVLAVIIRVFVFEPFYIPSGSMEPTLLTGDRIIVSKLSYRLGVPGRGDIIVFKYPRDPSRVFVKRVIGLPGETVALRESKLYVNGRQIPEPYLPEGLRFADFGPVRVPAGHLFMLGDNRNSSDDSRVWGFLDKRLIIGKAVAIYWPPDRIRVIRHG
ncbi:MAG: signal peptidase I [Desulfotomaculales bacterium]